MRTSIDLTKPIVLYVALAALLQLAAILLPRLGLPGLSAYVHIPYQRWIAVGALGLSILFGLVAATRHAARAAIPWLVPQSQALICVLLFVFFGAVGLALSIGV